MICSHCNMEVPDNLDHCPYCGEKLEASVSENSDTKKENNKADSSVKENSDKDAQAKTVTPGNSEGPESPQRKTTLMAGITAVILVAAAAAAVFAALQRPPKPNSEEQNKTDPTTEMAQGAEQNPSKEPVAEEPVPAEKEEPVVEEPVSAEKEEPVVEEEPVPAEKEEPVMEEATVPAEKEEPEEIDTRRSVDDVFHPDGAFFTYDGHTYCFYDVYTINENEYGNVTDSDAGAYKNIQKFCRDQDGHLAVINSVAENAVLFDETQERYDHTVFFGLSDENREGRWVWDDGTEDTLSLWSVKYGVQQPDNGNGYAVEHYAEFDYDRFNPEGSDNTGNWNDAEYLKNTSTFLCEWDYVLKGL